MKKLFRWVVVMMCMAWLLSMLDCGKEKPQVLDGPDMEYKPAWSEFTLSRSDSYAQYNFAFTVKEADPDPIVDGTCRGEDGTIYETETGIPIPAETLWALRRMNLEQLPDEEPWPEDLEKPLDMEIIRLTITLSDGTEVKKIASSSLSMEIYELLLPCFEKI